MTGEKGNGLIRKYGLNISRQAFKERAEEMGWKKVRASVHVVYCARKSLSETQNYSTGEGLNELWNNSSTAEAVVSLVLEGSVTDWFLDYLQAVHLASREFIYIAFLPISMFPHYHSKGWFLRESGKIKLAFPSHAGSVAAIGPARDAIPRPALEICKQPAASARHETWGT